MTTWVCDKCRFGRCVLTSELNPDPDEHPWACPWEGSAIWKKIEPKQVKPEPEETSDERI